MKRLMISMLFFIIFMGIVGAQTYNCNNNNIIMKLNDVTNAHGEVWNGAGNYPTHICYNDIFGSSYSGSNPHACTANNANKVIRLSGTTNAHAEIPGGSNPLYNTNVCFGDLVCNSIPGDLKCAQNEREILYLSSQSNAHLETSNGENYNNANGFKICCSSASAVPKIFNAKWKYFNGLNIATNAFVCPNTQIILSVETYALNDGVSVTFQIFEDDGILGSDPIGSTISSQVFNNQANFTLNLGDSSIKDLLQSFLSDESDGDLELYFEATTSTLPKVTSYIIQYTEDNSKCSYPKPIASIKAPVHKGVYFANTDVNFTSACSSATGAVTYEWTITQGASSFTNTNYEFIHSFTNAGQVNVQLKCTDSASKSEFAETQMLVIASPHILAYINKPEFRSFAVRPIPPPPEPYFPQEVEFSASDTFVVDAVTTCQVKCLGGSCPDKTQNSPSSCGGGSLNILDVPTGAINYSNFTFDWTFWDNNWNDDWTQFEGKEVYRGVVPYDDVSNTLLDKFMSVAVIHTPTGSSASFQRQFSLGRCLNKGSTYYSTSGALSTLEQNGACKGTDSIVGTADDCCPIGLQCGLTSGATYDSCYAPSNVVLKCEDFIDKNSCNSNNDPRIPRASYGGNPPACTYLNCLWDDVSSKCGLNVTRYNQTSEGCNGGGNGRIIGSCSYTTTTSECINGRRTINYNVIAGNVVTCRKDPVTVPCGSLSFELSFFGMREFFLSLIAIIVVYLGIYSYKRRRI